METQRAKVSALHGIWIVGMGLMVSCHTPAKTAQMAAPESRTPSKTHVKNVFDQHCAGCHGSDGRARTFAGIFMAATNLSRPAWQSKVTDTQMNTVICKGHRLMPAFENKLSAKEIAALVGYIRQIKRDS